MTPYFPVGLLPPEREQWLKEMVLPLPGWCRPDKAVRMAELVIHTKPMISVELGVFGARGTLALAEGHRAAGHGYVTGIDPWTVEAALQGTNELVNDEWWGKLDLEGIYRSAMATMVRHATLPHWQMLRQHSWDAHWNFADGSVGICHLDGNHDQGVSCEDLRVWGPKMAPGSLFIFDDIHWPSLQEVQRRIRDDYGAVLREEWEDWSVYEMP